MKIEAVALLDYSRHTQGCLEAQMTKESREFGGHAPRFCAEASPALMLRVSAVEQGLGADVLALRAPQLC